MEQLKEHLLNNNNEHTLTLKIRTPVKLKKKGHSFGEIYKTQTISLIVNKSYTQAVNEQLASEGVTEHFVAKQSWGKQLAPSLIEHEGILYIQGIFKSYLSNATFEHEGQPILKAEFEKFVAVTGGSSARQGTQQEVQVRKIKLKNVLSFEVS